MLGLPQTWINYNYAYEILNFRYLERDLLSTYRHPICISVARKHSRDHLCPWATSGIAWLVLKQPCLLSPHQNRMNAWMQCAFLEYFFLLPQPWTVMNHCLEGHELGWATVVPWTHGLHFSSIRVRKSFLFSEVLAILFEDLVST